jgi:galactokinase/mevalonate kinase-like predicted kinase
MTSPAGAFEHLISLPPRTAARFGPSDDSARPCWFAGSDPADQSLGSAGGTVHLLHTAWRAAGGTPDFWAWLRARRKLVVHGGGESRRLPAYAPLGKPLIPIPALRWSRGQRLDQTLLDLQLPGCHRLLSHAPPGYVTLVASGDVLVRFGRELPAFPEVDVLALGLWVTPEQASAHGVFFLPRARPDELAFGLQKPTPARWRELATDHIALVDTGLWLLSERALRVLFERSGGDKATGTFPDGHPRPYELYSEFGLALGTHPTRRDPLVESLHAAVVPLPGASFHHFGTNRQLITAVSGLMNLELDETKLGFLGARRHPDQYLQNAQFGFPLRQDRNHTLWVENACIPSTWQLAHEHLLTGVPENRWDLHLEPGVCLDFVPLEADAWGVRCYGIDDPFRGAVGDPLTRWLEAPVTAWFQARGLELEDARLDPATDLQAAPLFPVLRGDALEPRFLEWLFARTPSADPAYRRRWLAVRRLSARALAQEVNLDRLEAQRTANRQACLRPLFEHRHWSVLLNLDLDATAALEARSPEPLLPTLPEPDAPHALDPLAAIHEQMFRAAVGRHRATPGWPELERLAFARLRDLLVREAELAPVQPRCTVQEDQIVWGRSPVRLDLAGGWTDTPPYCLEFGGQVVNLAVDLNGQPPIQAFARLSPRPELVLRSIDLGAEQRIRTYAELDTFAEPGSAFAIAKAAFALAGFLPRFQAEGRFTSLAAQLGDFGGGIELSLLCAVPKGSGLGTSSLLAATLLATLADLGGLGWDRNVLFTRTLALEQMLTTGGGWQDQAGGVFRGLKLVETAPGLRQRPVFRWLPDLLFSGAQANSTVMLYYTGLTRLAADILQDVVRRLFLNSGPHLATLEAIGANAQTVFHAIQTDNYDALAAAINRSWQLNQQLDPGTNPPAVQAILDRVHPWLAAAKLLGAGGGGYLLLLARDEETARRIRAELTQHPPNPRARFVDFALSNTGLQLTRS